MYHSALNGHNSLLSPRPSRTMIKSTYRMTTPLAVPTVPDVLRHEIFVESSVKSNFLDLLVVGLRCEHLLPVGGRSWLEFTARVASEDLVLYGPQHTLR